MSDDISCCHLGKRSSGSHHNVECPAGEQPWVRPFPGIHDWVLVSQQRMEVDGIVYWRLRETCELRPMIELCLDGGGHWRWQPDPEPTEEHLDDYVKGKWGDYHCYDDYLDLLAYRNSYLTNA